MNSVFGVPAHPLMVHIPVVMIPLTLVLALLAMVLPRTARGASLGLLATATIGMIGAQLAVMSGEDLEHRVEESSLNHDVSLIHDHAELGEMTRTISFFVFLAAVAFAWRIWNDHLPERFRGSGHDCRGARRVPWSLRRCCSPAPSAPSGRSAPDTSARRLRGETCRPPAPHTARTTSADERIGQLTGAVAWVG